MRKSKANTGKQDKPEQDSWEFKLYIADATDKSLRATDNLKKICAEHLPAKCHIELVDLVKNPQEAKAAGIVAIPTLVRTMPHPVRTVIGDLSNTEKVLAAMNIEKGKGGGQAVLLSTEYEATIDQPVEYLPPYLAYCSA